MSDVQTQAQQGLRFKKFFMWGGAFIVLLGLGFLVRGDVTSGLVLAAAGVVSMLFAKRRTRKAGE